MSAALSLGKNYTQSAEKNPRLQYVVLPPQAQPDFYSAVAAGLSGEDRSIPSRFLYDDVGSALFDAITRLNEYYLTRKERSILAARADKIVRSVGKQVEIIEFGSGSAEKTRLLLNAALSEQRTLRFVPIDISQAALRSSATGLLNELAGLDVYAVAAEYRDGLQALPATSDPRLFLFLGSNLGNFKPADAEGFLSGIGSRMHMEDRLLVGIDLVKDPAIIELAYNDPAGVTSAFNKNLLNRVNRDLNGGFDLDGFEHQAPYLSEAEKVEMRLVARKNQWVRIGGMKGSLRFKRGDYIHTEDSHKYTLGGFEALAASAGLCLEDRWLDDDQWFALTLLRKL